MHAQARRRAAALGMNFSAYVNHLIREDMSRGGSLVVREEPGDTLPVSHHGPVSYRNTRRKS